MIDLAVCGSARYGDIAARYGDIGNSFASLGTMGHYSVASHHSLLSEPRRSLRRGVVSVVIRPWRSAPRWCRFALHDLGQSG